MRRMSMAKAPPLWWEGLADLTRPAREDVMPAVAIGEVLLELALTGMEVKAAARTVGPSHGLCPRTPAPVPTALPPLT